MLLLFIHLQIINMVQKRKTASIFLHVEPNLRPLGIWNEGEIVSTNNARRLGDRRIEKW